MFCPENAPKPIMSATVFGLDAERCQLALPEGTTTNFHHVPRPRHWIRALRHELCGTKMLD